MNRRCKKQASRGAREVSRPPRPQCGTSDKRQRTSNFNGLKAMNSSNCSFEGRESPEAEVLAVDVLLIYEDLSTGLRARRAFEEAVQRIEMPADFKVDLWRFDLLWESALREAALKQAAKAGVLVISAHGRTELPATVQVWLSQWLERKDDQPCALVLSLDQEIEGTPSAKRILDFLQARAREVGVEVFAHFGTAPEPGWDLTVESLRHRADTRTAILDDILRRPQPHSHWGLNE